MGESSKRLFVFVLVAGIVIPGLMVNFLSSQGADMLGAIVWTIGFGTTIFLLWFGWLREIDFTGPAGMDSTTGADDQEASQSSEG